MNTSHREYLCTYTSGWKDWCRYFCDAVLHFLIFIYVPRTKHFIVKKLEHLVWKEIIYLSIVYCYHYCKKINGKFQCQFKLY